MKLEELYDQVKITAEKAADKINKTTDLAALQVKRSVAQNHLKEAYAALGHAVYLQMKLGQDQAAKSVSLLEKITEAKKEVADLETQIKQLKSK